MRSLIETNPHLKDPVHRREMLRRSVIDSSYVEGARHLKLPEIQAVRPKGQMKAKGKRKDEA